MSTSVAVVWLAGLGGLSLAAYTFALLAQGQQWSTRLLPSALFRIGTGVAFSAWVHPALGIFAAISGYWLFRQGFPAASGGTFWPIASAGVLLGVSAPQWAVDVGILMLLGAGIIQAAVGACQALKLPVFYHPHMIHGTMGHRTGYGIFLAALMPLAFLTDYPWVLVAIYLVGVVLSKSSVAAVAALAGLLIIVPRAWWLVPVAIGLVLFRSLKWMPRHYRWSLWKPRHWKDSWVARFGIWREAIRHTRPWPYWLVGHGALSFAAAARTWIARAGLKENYQEAHNDYIEGFYEYGVLGVVAAVLWLSQFGGQLALGDPITGALVALAVASLANFPLRVAPLGACWMVLVIALMRRGPVWGF